MKKGCTKKIISSPFAPKAIGPYSQAIEVNCMMYTSGQIPLDPQTGEVVGDNIAEQTERVMQNLQAVLAEAGVSFDHVAKTTCFLTDLADFDAFNEVYGKYFPVNPPARSCVQVVALPKGVKIEIEAIVEK